MSSRVLKYDVIFPALILIFVTILFFMCFGYAWRTAQLPMIIGGMTIGLLIIELCLRLFGSNKKEKVGGQKDKRKMEVSEEGGEPDRVEGLTPQKKRLVVTLLSILFFFVAVPVFGFTMTSLLLSFGLIHLLGYKKPITNLIYSVCLVGGLVILFGYFLGIHLTSGMIFEMLFD